MKNGLIAAMIALGGAAFATDVTVWDLNESPFDFPSVNTNGLGQALRYYYGADGTLAEQANRPVFVNEVVNGVTRKVAVLNQWDTFFANHGLRKNGGGDYVNQYSLVFDVKLNRNDWFGFYNTNDSQSNDSDLFFNPGNGGLGIIGDYEIEASTSPFALDSWQRVVLTVNCDGPSALLGQDQRMNVYINGVFSNGVDLGGGLDGRWALYTVDDPDAFDHIFFFGDNDFEESAAGFVAQLAATDAKLDAGEVASLGAVGSLLTAKKLSGSVTLEDSAAFPNLVAYRMDFRSPGTTNVVFSRQVTVDPAGDFSLNVLGAAGLYDVAVFSRGFLSAMIPNVSVTSAGVSNLDFGLVNGDIDSDNTVTVFDYDKLSAYFDMDSSSASWLTPDADGIAPAYADLDGDGFITVFDYDILSRNFDKSGA